MSMCVGVGKPVYRGYQMITSKAGSSFWVPWMELRLPGRVARTHFAGHTTLFPIHMGQN